MLFTSIYLKRPVFFLVTVKISRSISDGNVMASYFVMMLLVFRHSLHSCYMHCIQILELHGIQSFNGANDC
jgi:hypothetical protein